MFTHPSFLKTSKSFRGQTLHAPRRGRRNSEPFSSTEEFIEVKFHIFERDTHPKDLRLQHPDMAMYSASVVDMPSSLRLVTTTSISRTENSQRTSSES
ncbi:hypothetical protein Tco_0308871 [Tanacetum coccineum]|uniref:Uncharacterized protein n=1 Tax=Tanacetum coccineum TaxID=301880 RepID=A0ABQ5CNC6_9ASTR